MHETRFADEIVFVIKHKLEKEMLAKRISVNIRLSPFSHVSAQSLREAFQVAAINEPFRSNVHLNITTMEFDFYCRDCKKISKASEPVFNCPLCKSANLEIHKEREFIIDSLEVE